MICTVNHLLIELGVSRRKEGREIMARKSQLAEAERLIDKLMVALQAADELWAMLPFDSGKDIDEIARRVRDIQDDAVEAGKS